MDLEESEREDRGGECAEGQMCVDGARFQEGNEVESDGVARGERRSSSEGGARGLKSL